METVTHVAGPVARVHERAIQRCAICGEKLCDNLGQAGPLQPDGRPPRFLTWPERALVQVTSGNPTQFLVVGDFVETANLPDDFCLALVE